MAAQPLAGAVGYVDVGVDERFANGPVGGADLVPARTRPEVVRCVVERESGRGNARVRRALLVSSSGWPGGMFLTMTTGMTMGRLDMASHRAPWRYEGPSSEE